jgi:protein phosphatase
MKALAFGLSDVGRRRESNEDEFLVEPRLDLYVVADGMGGHAAGEVASRIAVDSLREALSGPRNGGAAVSLRNAVHEANVRICDSIQTHADQRGMGTTLVALLVEDERAIIGHVGDSRAYLLRDGTLRRLTSDHSWVNEQVKLGLLSDEAAQRHPMRNIVTRALGSRTEVAAEVREEGLHSGDVFLLCSDGLNTMLPDEEIEGILARFGSEPEKACRELVARANERGGEDNTTVVVVHVETPGG